MDARDKLRKFLDDNGIQFKWFAAQLGMNPKALYLILGKKKPIPKKYWKQVILKTKNHITLEDLADIDLDFDQEIENKKSKKKKD